MSKFLLGKLTTQAIPHEWFTLGGTIFLTIMGLVVVIFLTRTKRWSWLWNEWLTSTDPKKIGIMYMLIASLMLFRGALDAAMIWLQQALSSGSSHGYLDAN